MSHHKMRHICPCCGFDDLDVPPYLKIREVGLFDAKPPYFNSLGKPSYEVCPCCGFEFGFDDDPGGGAPGTSFGEYLYEWIAHGMIWFDQTKKPMDFDLFRQFDHIGKEYFVRKHQLPKLRESQQ